MRPALLCFVRGKRGLSRSPTITVDARMLHASGIGTYLRNLLPRIVASRPDWSFTILGDPDELRKEPWVETRSVSIIPFRPAIYSVGEQIQLAWRPPASHMFWAPHYNFPLLWRSKLLVTIHDVCHLALPQLVRGPHRRAYARFMFRALRRRASCVICVSEFTRAEFLRLVSGNGRPPVTVHNGIDAAWFGVRPAVSPHARPYLLYVGNVKPHKNLGTLLEAFRQIAGSIPHDLVIVGRQTGFITADEAVVRSAAGLQGRVRFTGELPSRDLERFMAHADAFVFPSLYEGFGFPPLEAMAAGCPTVVARSASLPEVCGDAALYFDPSRADQLASALTRLLSDEGLRGELGRRGRQQAAKFSWDRCSEQTLAVIEATLAR